MPLLPPTTPDPSPSSEVQFTQALAQGCQLVSLLLSKLLSRVTEHLSTQDTQKSSALGTVTNTSFVTTSG